MDKAEEKRALAGEVMELSTAALLLKHRYLARAVSRLRVYPGGKGLSCDGARLMYEPDWVLGRYKQGERLVTHDLLHVLMHCIFRHWSVGEILKEDLWDLSCDIAAEGLISSSAPELMPEERGAERATELRKLSIALGLISAERLYDYLRAAPAEEVKRLGELFAVDDHKLWYRRRKKNYEDEPKVRTLPIGISQEDQELKPTNMPGDTGEGQDSDREPQGEMKDRTEEAPGGAPKEQEDPSLKDWLDQHRMDTEDSLEKMWEDVARQLSSDLENFGKNKGSGDRQLVRVLKDADRDRVDYSAFLRRFAVAGEVMRVDPDSFDVNFYTYGLGLYGNAALIEPLEYRECRRVKEFVVALDTSGSVDVELAEAFVRKTFSMLRNEESFFSRVSIYLLQCDNEVREAVCINDRKDLEKYISEMEIRGLGGTDFRPVFDYVDGLIKRGELRDLKGLIYFTDGFGDFPETRPGYETAFAFVRDPLRTEEPPEVPVWAIRLILDKEDILYG